MSVIPFEDAACGKVRGHLDSYLSNELLSETNQEVSRHLEGCPQCTAELGTRARVRTGLKAAVRSTAVPSGLEARVERAVRAQSSRTRAGLYTMAIAASVIICLALISLTRAKPGPEAPILAKATGRLAVVLNVGLRDHLQCAVFRKYDRTAVQLSLEFADMTRMLKAKLPDDFRIIQSHRCTAGGRHYVHFIVTHGDKLLSLILTRKQAGESLNGGVYQEGVDRFQVVGFESHDYLAYVISDLDAQQNLQLAVNIAPAVREYLATHAG